MINNRVLVTGGAGFIGSHLVERLVDERKKVMVVDDLSSGKIDFLSSVYKKIKFFHGSLLDKEFLEDVFREKINFVFHLAANPEVRIGSPEVHFRQNLLATYFLLEKMRKNDVKKIAFTSTSTVYGEAETIPTPEDASLQPISLYGASKLGCEALLLAYSHTFSFQSWIFRFANVIGRRGTHGVLVDFIKKLRKNPSKLEILGDGKQKKSYMLVEDCIDAMLFAVEKTSGGVFNLGSKDWIEVNEIAEIVCDELKLKNVRFHYTGGKRGWVGDVPRMRLSIDKMEKLGWRPRFSSRESIRIAVRILANDLQEGKIYR